MLVIETCDCLALCRGLAVPREIRAEAMEAVSDKLLRNAPDMSMVVPNSVHEVCAELTWTHM